MEEAIKTGNLYALKYIVDGEANDVLSEALQLAYQYGELEIIEFLIEKNVNIINTLSFMCGYKYGHLHVIEYMCEKYPNVCTDIDIYHDVLYNCVDYGYLDIIEYLVENVPEDLELDLNADTLGALLYSAAMHGNLDIVEYLVRKGANVNENSDDYLSPLCAAAEFGHLEIVKFLVEKGAIVNDIAINWAEDLDIIKFLEDHKYGLDSFITISIYNKNIDEECSICLDSIKKEYILCINNHAHCKTCMNDAFKILTRRCPLCRCTEFK